MADLPGHARTVIIGGGAVGASSLYHLALMGETDCVLLEKNELTSGSTWHAAGNCPNYSASWSIMLLQRYSASLYRELGAKTDYPMNYHVTGAIRLAHSKERMREFEHVTSMGRVQGHDFEMLSVSDLKDRYPYLETHDLEGGHYDATDGDIDPAQLTQAFAKGARDLGARVVRFCEVQAIDRVNGEWLLKTNLGEIRCEKVVNAAGYRGQELSRMFIPFGGREIPQVTLAHQYLITEEIPELKKRKEKLPLLRDPDSSYYLRQEKDGLLLGPYERHCRAHWMDQNDPMPDDFSFQLFEDDLERISWHIEDACKRVPLLGSVGVTRVINGPIPYAPDGNPLIGPMPGVPNAFEACVFTFGIVQGGGAGKILAEWVVHGETEWDMWSVDPRRFTDYADQDFANQKGLEIYGHEYSIHFPHYEWPAGRNKKLSPIHDKISSLNAHFGARGGWERAVYYNPDGEKVDEESLNTFDREGPWFEHVKSECEAVATKAGFCDLPGFSRYIVKGDGAAEWLLKLITGPLPKEGRVNLGYFADQKGRIVTEMSVAAMGGEEFQLLTGAGARWHDIEWLKKHLPEKHDIVIEDQSDEVHTILLSGPEARKILALICDADLSLGWLSHQNTTIGGQECWLVRVSYVGELGWELHMPRSSAAVIFEKLIEAGTPLGLKPFGMYAMDSLRLEKGYRSWKQDLTTDYTMYEAGLGRFVKLDKDEFLGREALLKEKQQGSSQEFVALKLEDHVCDAPYLSAIYDQDKVVGLVTSAGYGHRVGHSIALGVVEKGADAAGRQLYVGIFGEKVSAVVLDNPSAYDPKNEKLRA